MRLLRYLPVWLVAGLFFWSSCVAGGGDPLTEMSDISNPVVTSIGPEEGPASGGTVVSIKGERLLDTIRITFGGFEADEIVVESGQAIHCIAPPSPWWDESVDLVIETPHGSVLVADGFRYVTPPKDQVGSGESASPYISKIDAALSFLLILRQAEHVPEEIREIVMRDTVSASMRFTHELSVSEIASTEELGLEFLRLSNGEVAHSGAIYGADIPWDRVDDIAELESVIRIESTWQPGVQDPVG